MSPTYAVRCQTIKPNLNIGLGGFKVGKLPIIIVIVHRQIR